MISSSKTLGAVKLRPFIQSKKLMLLESKLKDFEKNISFLN